MTAVVVVPGGLGETYRPLFGADTSVVPGASRGEAAVDFLLVSDATALSKLQSAPDDIPVIGVMALLACCGDVAENLNLLRDKVQHSEHWPAVMRLWQLWRGGGGSRQPSVFRATALRGDGLSRPHVNEIARAAASGVWRRWQWTADMTAYDIEVVAILTATHAIVGVPLTAGWHACARAKKGGFFPVEASRGGGSASQEAAASAKKQISSQQPVLRPSVCHGLLLRAGVRPSDLYCDPMCGVGSLPAEALSRFGCSFALGGDLGRSAVRDAGRRTKRCGRFGRPLVAVGLTVAPGQVQADGGHATAVRVRVSLTPKRGAPVMEVARWDVRALPLRSGVVDKIVVDIPWGNRGKAEPVRTQRLEPCKGSRVNLRCSLGGPTTPRLSPLRCAGSARRDAG